MKIIYRFFLKQGLKLHNWLYKVISILAIKVEGGIHPKHRLMGYHQFFLDNISSSDTILDIGCGNGALAYDLAGKAKFVTGIDIVERNIIKAREKYNQVNIKYLVGDATKGLKGQKFDVIVLSNVLEHIEDRVAFLSQIKPLARKFLIRVPMIDRDWLPLYKKELGVEWRLDKTHFIEYTDMFFKEEIEKAGYLIESFSIKFGEIWAVVKQS
jgi:SAM-dependent methyltransferase